ncbi:MAG: NTP transferase domain-containing protein [Oscillospiraceae bacterium]|jgi:mannose-1-phosphate guanylyltransferase/phosphomannomutase|nr:NTP transferase domain-containing protein [Oscillospiraceae bacterium]
MKAIILAGGEGSRLQPVSIGIPKPMTRILDKPIVEHTLNLLKRCGITEICMTLRYLPKVITDYFGEGEQWGVNLDYRVEDEPLGTAGGVKACADFLDGSDFLVVSGDAFLNADLNKLIEFRESKQAEAVIALAESAQPLEYGLVLTAPDGRVTGFIEKPSRDRVVTDRVNTGIYVFSGSVLNEIPDGKPFDFAKDLFPAMLKRGAPIFAAPLDGSWLDVGSCSAYHKANMDALTQNGLTRYVGDNVTIEPGALIGQHVVLGFGSVVRSGAKISCSVIDGAEVGANAEVRGAILCRGSKLGANSKMRRGGVLGENASVGSGCYLADGVRVFPNCNIAPGNRVCAHVTAPRSTTGGLERGIMRGEFTPEYLLKLGQTIGALFGNVGVAGKDATAEVIAAGALFAGAEAYRLDAANAAVAAFAGRAYKLKLTVFCGEDGLRFTDALGQPICRETERKIENCPESPVKRQGNLTEIRGCKALYLAAAGALPEWFTLSDDGLTVTLTDETGKEWAHSRLLAALTLAEVTGRGRLLALPYDAPLVCDKIAATSGGKVLRLWRDENAAELMAERPYASDGTFLASRLAEHAKRQNVTYAEFMGKLPPIHSEAQTLPLPDGLTGRLMRNLADYYSEAKSSEFISGVRFDFGGTYAGVTPGLRELKIVAEAASSEAAKELCGDLAECVRKILSS